MHQKPLLESTRDFLSIGEQGQQGILLHESYERYVRYGAIFLLILAGITSFIIDYRLIISLGLIIALFGFSFEYILKQIYDFTGQDAVLFYALRFYDDPTVDNLKQLHSWNKNPFDFSEEYRYPILGKLVEEGKEKNDTVQFVRQNIPDTLRMIEQREREDYQTLVDIDLEIPEYYSTLLEEANYCYKFGAYTSTAILLRKITENLVTDILTAKGLYVQLEDETFGDEINLLEQEVLISMYGEDIASDIREFLHTIREIGNKGAHKTVEVNQEELEGVVGVAHNVLGMLFKLRRDSYE